MEKPKKNNSEIFIAFVITPLQLINASEYVYENKVESASLFILRNTQKWRRSVFDSMPSMALWDQVTEFEYSENLFCNRNYPTSLRRIGSLIDDLRFKSFFKKIKRKNGEFDALIIGNINDIWLRHVANTLPNCRRVVECEDGAATLSKSWRMPNTWVAKKIFFGFNTNQPRQNELYTAYSNIVRSGINVRTNNYNYTSSLFREGEIKINNDVWIIGQPLVELSLMTSQSYISSLTAILRNYQTAGRFVYCPHPSESADNVNHICSHLGIDARNKESIIEVDIISSKEIPGKIASLYSSVINSVQKIFKDRISVDVYKPDKDLFTKKMCDSTYKNIYDALEQNTSPEKFYKISGKHLDIY